MALSYTDRGYLLGLIAQERTRHGTTDIILDALAERVICSDGIEPEERPSLLRAYNRACATARGDIAASVDILEGRLSP